jgi:hypothetical protein
VGGLDKWQVTVIEGEMSMVERRSKQTDKILCLAFRRIEKVDKNSCIYTDGESILF